MRGVNGRGHKPPASIMGENKVGDTVRTELGNGVIRAIKVDSSDLYSIIGQSDDGTTRFAKMLLKEEDIQKYEKVEG